MSGVQVAIVILLIIIVLIAGSALRRLANKGDE